MRLAAAAYRLREAARSALESGNLDSVLTLASEAESLCSTTEGERLRRLGLLLAYRLFADQLRDPIPYGPR